MPRPCTCLKHPHVLPCTWAKKPKPVELELDRSIPHGTRRGYNEHGCRCEACLAWSAAARRGARRRAAEASRETEPALLEEVAALVQKNHEELLARLSEKEPPPDRMGELVEGFHDLIDALRDVADRVERLEGAIEAKRSHHRKKLEAPPPPEPEPEPEPEPDDEVCFIRRLNDIIPLCARAAPKVVTLDEAGVTCQDCKELLDR